MEMIGQKFTDLLLQKAKSEIRQHHFDGSTNEALHKLASATKGRVNEESYEEIFGIKRDRSRVGNHKGDFPNKTQAKLSCIKQDGQFIINHITKDDEWFIITLVEPEEITLLKFSRDQLWRLNPNHQNGQGDYMVTASKNDLLSVNPEILDKSHL